MILAQLPWYRGSSPGHMEAYEGIRATLVHMVTPIAEYYHVGGAVMALLVTGVVLMLWRRIFR